MIKSNTFEMAGTLFFDWPIMVSDPLEGERANISIDLDKDDKSIQQKEIFRALLIKQVALTALYEFTVTIALASVACFFVARAAIQNFITRLISIIVLTTLIHTFQKLISYHIISPYLAKKDLKKNLSNSTFTAFIITYPFQEMRYIQFATIYSVTVGVLIHEIGHALTALFFFKIDQLKIVIKPFEGGYNKISYFGLTKCGELIGEHWSYIAWKGGGPLFDILQTTLLISAAHKFRKTHPELKSYLRHIALQNVICSIFYALSALTVSSQKSQSHDYFQLWKRAGIPPIVSAITMVAVPVIVQIILSKNSD